MLVVGMVMQTVSQALLVAYYTLLQQDGQVQRWSPLNSASYVAQISADVVTLLMAGHLAIGWPTLMNTVPFRE